MKIRVIWPGKTKKRYYQGAIEDYASRIAKMVPFELVETREESLTDHKRRTRIRKESRRLAAKTRVSHSVLLDKEGKMLTSEEWAGWLASVSGADVDFVVGGPEGFSLSGETLRLSFGKITLPHELARVVLLEQIYRALTILKRIPYHK